MAIQITREVDKKIGLGMSDLRDLLAEADRCGVTEATIKVRISYGGAPWRITLSETED